MPKVVVYVPAHDAKRLEEKLEPEEMTVAEWVRAAVKYAMAKKLAS